MMRANILVLAGLLTLSVESLAQSGAASIEVDFTAPSGYVIRHEGGLVFITPQVSNDQTPCIYGIAPPRPSKGSLEADAEAALLETVAAGWPRSSDYRIAMRGVAAAGWPYFLQGGDFLAQIQGSSSPAAVMAMVFPAPGNRVNVVFGLGVVGRCTFNDVPFAQLFHSLRPHGWSIPARSAIEKVLIGTWTVGSSRGLSQHTFHGDGRYSRSGSADVFGNMTSFGSNARYTLRGSEINVTHHAAGQVSERFHVNIYDQWHILKWRRAMTALYDDGKSPFVVEYVRETP